MLVGTIAESGGGLLGQSEPVTFLFDGGYGSHCLGFCRGGQAGCEHLHSSPE